MTHILESGLHSIDPAERREAILQAPISELGLDELTARLLGAKNILMVAQLVQRTSLELIGDCTNDDLPAISTHLISYKLRAFGLALQGE